MKRFENLTIISFLTMVLFTFATLNVFAETNAVKRGKYGEAPMMAEMVDKGVLPPVNQRLPENPLVVTPFGEIGRYGGTLRQADVSQEMHLIMRVRDVGMFRYDFSASKPTVDLAELYQLSGDRRTLTITLRKGHKWSDGHPFTVDDIMFMWEDVRNNDVLSPNGPGAFWEPGGVRAVFRKIDETTLEISFAAPYPVVLDRLGRSYFSSEHTLFLPKHYLQKWHIKYNPEAHELAKDEGFDDWDDAFNNHRTPPRFFEVGRPTLGPWIPEKQTTDRLLSVRNPYFHMVDSESNQLPYIDHWELRHVGDKELMTMQASSGGLDFSAYYLDLKDMAVFRENEAKGNYRTLLPKSLRTSDLAIFFNRTVKDEELRKLFNKKYFRIALSIALNRNKMNDVVFFGLGTPFPALPLPSASFFQPRWATRYMEYDPDRANRMLDSLGLTRRDRDDFRLKSDGERLSMLLEIGVEEGAKEDLCEMVVADWRAVGVEGICKMVDSTLFNERRIANEQQLSTWHIGRTTLFGRADPLWFGFSQPSQQAWAAQWTLWLVSNGTEGVEPPQAIKDLAELFVRFQQTLPDSPEFIELGSRYYGWFSEELPIIGTVGLQPTPLVVANRLKNVPTEEDGITWGSDHNFFQPYWFEQFYIDE